ncbi:Arm DNA-binding domain-containing protein [Leuconostoc suionicum]|uniref:Arm DNA-binding domain-containing protein n=1 Tax=Leuconostoc suionicum TaxID=1511761 RepID=UPI00233ED868|nr:Arm DNA-binding domain-containing protein [Leuconostoc suionicum]MDC2815810.1 Arm DNA-binding domain-containing protein [Leuconostoc suionicum]
MASFEKRGKKWRAVISITDNRGIRKKLSKTFDTKREATTWSTEQETSLTMATMFLVVKFYTVTIIKNG